MKTWKFLEEVVNSQSGISSKRVCGLIGWILCLLVLIYCTVFEEQAPEITDTILWCCMGLLGLDSITGIWKGRK